MKPYGMTREETIIYPDAADLRAMGAPSRWAKIRSANRRAARRRHAKAARRANRNLCTCTD